jgi:pimeloyl-ACP methyl ester carboxylesterase
MADASKEEFDAFTEFGRRCTTAECAARYLDATAEVDVADLLGQVRAPTLVGHVRGDTRVPFEAGGQLAANIPGAHFVALPGRNHVLLRGDPARERWFEEIEAFLQE